MTAPATVVTRNSAGSVTSTSGTFSAAVAAGAALVLGISVASDAPAISSVADSKGNSYALIGHQSTTVGKPIWIYYSTVTTPLTTSDTVTVTISSGAIINFIGVAQAPGTMFIPLRFSGTSNTGVAASLNLPVSALATPANGYRIAFSVNDSAAPTWLTPGPTVLVTVSGGGGPFFSCAYEDATDFPGSLEIDMSPASTASMAVTATMPEYTDFYTDAYSSLYGQYLGIAWPQSGALELSVQLLVNGTWTDITGYVYQRDGSVSIGIGSGRPDESSKIVTAQCQLELNNRGGTFSPKNAASPFYPYITRNTQLRALVPVSYNSTDAGAAFAFWGEVSSWPPGWDETGADVWTDVTASGITRRLNQQATLGSPLSRFYLGKDPADPLYPVVYWPMEDGEHAATLAEVTGLSSPMSITSGPPTLASDSSFIGSDPIPVLNGATLFGSTGVYGDTGVALFTSPGTWPFVPRAGLTSLTAAECWGGAGGGTNGYQASAGKGAAGGGSEYAKETGVAVTAGSSYLVAVGTGGAGGALSGDGTKANPGADGGTSSFSGDAVTVTAHGGGGGLFTGSRGGKGGTGSTNAVHHDGGAGGKNSGALGGGSGGGSSGGTAAGGNAGSSGGASNTGAAGGTAVAGGGAGGAGGSGGIFNQPGGGGNPPGGGGGSGGLTSGSNRANAGGNGGAGQVRLTWTPLVSPAYNVVRFLLHVPAAGDIDGSPVIEFLTSGRVGQLILTYNTAAGGSLTMSGNDGLVTTLFTSAPLTGINGGLYMVSMELTPGATIGYNLALLKIGSPVVASTSGTASASGAIGVVTSIDVNPIGFLTGTSFGHLVVQYSFESLTVLAGGNSGLGPITGWDGELAGQRYIRVCAEEGVTCAILGSAGTTPAMGPQPDDTLINVLQQVEDLDGGLQAESAAFFGLTYRCRSVMASQLPRLIADYSLAHLSPPFQPVADDQLIRNIVTVSRVNGSSVTVRQATGPLSYLPPPNGVGQYTYALSVNAHADSQLAAVAARILAQGTVDEYRYPQVSFRLSRPAVRELFGSLTALIPGDRLKILSPPSFLTAATIDQLAVGFAVTLSAFQFDLTLNCVPASPFGP